MRVTWRAQVADHVFVAGRAVHVGAVAGAASPAPGGGSGSGQEQVQGGHVRQDPVLADVQVSPAAQDQGRPRWSAHGGSGRRADRAPARLGPPSADPAAQQPRQPVPPGGRRSPTRRAGLAAAPADGVRWQSDYWISGLRRGGMRVSALGPCGGCGLQDGPRAENLRWRDRQRPPVRTAPLPESSIVIQPNEVCAAATALDCTGS